MAKYLNVGEAIYIEGKTKIKVSESEDWGWCYGEDSGHVIIKLDKSGNGAYTAEVVEQTITEENEEVLVDDVRVRPHPKNNYPWKVSARIICKSKKINKTVLFQERVSLSRLSQLKGSDYEMNEIFLIKKSGYYPTLFFFMLGSTGNGKTCWVTALSSREAKNNLRLNNIHYFEPYTKETPAPTLHNEVNFKTFFLSKGNEEDTTALIFVVDLGGEVNNLNLKNEDTRHIRDLDIDEYASGVFVVRNEKWLFSGETIDANDPDEYIFQLNNNTEKCYILTGADRIKEILEGKDLDQDLKEALKWDLGLTFDNVENEEYKKLKEKLLASDFSSEQYETLKSTFKKFDFSKEQYETLKDSVQSIKEKHANYKYKIEKIYLTPNSPIFCQALNQEQMNKNQAITSSIMGLNRNGDENTYIPCFTVSCGCYAKDEKGYFKIEKRADKPPMLWERSYNVAFPLIYMLQMMLAKIE